MTPFYARNCIIFRLPKVEYNYEVGERNAIFDLKLSILENYETTTL